MLQFPNSRNCDLVEIGSSDGVESKIYLSSHIHSNSYIYEPRSEAVEVISRTLRDSSLNHRVFVHPKAVVANIGDASKFQVSNSGHLSRITLDSEPDRLNPTVEEILIESVISSYSKNSVILKMDLEGYEIFLLKKLLNCLNDNEPIAFLIELHQGNYDEFLALNVFESMFRNGFKVYALETATHPKPTSLSHLLFEKPIRIASRRGLWKIADGCENELISHLAQKNVVYNPFTAEISIRSIRSILLTRNITFMDLAKRPFFSFWNLVYKINK